MKLLKIFALTVLAAVTFTACSDDECDGTPAPLKIVASQTMIPTLGGDGSVTVNQKVSEAYAKEDWLTVSKAGNVVNVTAVPNNDRESRHAKLVIKSTPMDSVIIAISQYGTIYNAEGCTNIVAGPSASSYKMPVIHNVETKVISCPSWAKAELADEVLTITIDDNTSVEAREGEVKVGTASGKYTNTIKIAQSGNADGCTSIETDGNGKTVTLNVVAGTQVKECPEWVNAEVKSGVLTIAVQKNTTEDPREGIVTYGNDTYTNSITIAQEAASLWNPLGKALYREDCISGLFGYDAFVYEVDIQEKIDQPGLYRLVNPYGASFPLNEPGDWDNSQNYYMYVNCTDPAGCYIEAFDTGMYWADFGKMIIFSMADYSGMTPEEAKAAGLCGTLENGLITLPAKSLLLQLTEYQGGSIYYANTRGQFAIQLPSASANAVKKVATKVPAVKSREITSAVPVK